jgi:hypothetical protein
MNNQKQIYVVYDYRYEKEKIIMLTTSTHKVRLCLLRKMNDNDDIFYKNQKLSKEEQLKQFKHDFKFNTRETINNNLVGIRYDYVYDGEEW